MHFIRCISEDVYSVIHDVTSYIMRGCATPKLFVVGTQNIAYTLHIYRERVSDIAPSNKHSEHTQH